MDGSSSTRKSKSLRRRLDRGEDDFNDRWGDQELSEEEQEQYRADEMMWSDRIRRAREELSKHL